MDIIAMHKALCMFNKVPSCYLAVNKGCMFAWGKPFCGDECVDKCAARLGDLAKD